MASATAFNLSSNDSSIIQALFDPEGALSEGVRIISQSTNSTLQCPSSIEAEERKAIQLLNTETPLPSEIHRAISELTKIISRDPSYASAYNNRAQATRLLFDIDDFAQHLAEVHSIISDLTMAILHASPATPMTFISAKDAAVLSSAHTHRGYLVWLAYKPATPLGVFSTIEGLKDLSKEELEEFASREFFLGRRYANKVARELSVRTNPYAKLCGSIVKEALRKEVADYHTAGS